MWQFARFKLGYSRETMRLFTNLTANCHHLVPRLRWPHRIRLPCLSVRLPRARDSEYVPKTPMSSHYPCWSRWRTDKEKSWSSICSLMTCKYQRTRLINVLYMNVGHLSNCQNNMNLHKCYFTDPIQTSTVSSFFWSRRWPATGPVNSHHIYVEHDLSSSFLHTISTLQNKNRTVSRSTDDPLLNLDSRSLQLYRGVTRGGN